MSWLLQLFSIKRCHASKVCAKKRSYILIVKDEEGKEKRRQVIKHTPVELQVMLAEKPPCYEVYTTSNGCRIG